MTPSRWAAGATLLLAGGALAGCGSATASSPTAGSSRPVDAVRLSADHVTCTDSASLRTCTMLVTYTNGSSSPLDLDASETRVVDAAGQVWRATTVGAPPVRTSVSPCC